MTMTKIQCFMIEPTDRLRRKLRRYASGKKRGKCSAMPGPEGYHNASAPFDVAPAVWTEHDGFKSYSGGSDDAPPRDDPRWPTSCVCGYIFQDADEWQLFNELLYVRKDTGEELTLRDAPPGAMWNAFWYPPAFGHGPDGLALMVMTPAGEWHIDGESSNGPGWTRTGTPPLVTARPSILIGNNRYHGFLTDGRLEEC